MAGETKTFGMALVIAALLGILTTAITGYLNPVTGGFPAQVGTIVANSLVVLVILWIIGFFKIMPMMKLQNLVVLSVIVGVVLTFASAVLTGFLNPILGLLGAGVVSLLATAILVWLGIMVGKQTGYVKMKS